MELWGDAISPALDNPHSAIMCEEEAQGEVPLVESGVKASRMSLKTPRGHRTARLLRFRDKSAQDMTITAAP